MIKNEDQPGVIGEVGTILGRHGINIANFALGRGPGGAVGVVNVDGRGGRDGEAIDVARVEAICGRSPAIQSGVAGRRFVRSEASARGRLRSARRRMAPVVRSFELDRVGADRR